MTTQSLRAMSGAALPAIRRTTRARRSQILLATATFSLFAFYYVARADLVGTRPAGGGWLTVSAPVLSPTGHFMAAALVLGVIPVVAATWVCGLHLRDLGLGRGDWRAGLFWLAIGLPGAVAAGWIASGDPMMRTVYPLDPGIVATWQSFAPHALRNALYFVAWEVLFRGVLLFGLRSSLGDGNANAGQTGFSVLAHFGRPMTETFAALPAGFLFGSICLRTGSIWYVALIHWTVGTSMDWFIVSGA